VSTPDSPAALERPTQRLAGFQKINLAPQQTKRVTFSVKVSDLAFFDEESDRYEVDRGSYGFQLGGSAADRDRRNRAVVDVTGELATTPAVVTLRPVVAGDADLGISQRVKFPVGSQIDPQLTVSLSDESLFGYRTRGQSTNLPSGLRVRYDSNRPDVVSVGDGGLVAQQAGIATITATVSYHGETASGTLVVYVQ